MVLILWRRYQAIHETDSVGFIVGFIIRRIPNSYFACFREYEHVYMNVWYFFRARFQLRGTFRCKYRLRCSCEGAGRMIRSHQKKKKKCGEQSHGSADSRSADSRSADSLSRQIGELPSVDVRAAHRPTDGRTFAPHHIQTFAICETRLAIHSTKKC